MLKYILATSTSALVGAAGVAIFSAYLTITAPLAATVAVPDRSVDAALRMCAWINEHQPKADCKVSHRPRVINFTLEVSATEAKAVCTETAGVAVKTGEFNSNVWWIQVFHPRATDPTRCAILGKKS